MWIKALVESSSYNHWKESEEPLPREFCAEASGNKAKIVDEREFDGKAREWLYVWCYIEIPDDFGLSDKFLMRLEYYNNQRLTLGLNATQEERNRYFLNDSR